MSQYQKKHSPPHTHPDHQTSFINFLPLLLSIASSLFNLRAWQFFSTTSVQVIFGLPLGLEPLLHTPCFSSPSHLLFATHARTFTACFAVVPRLYSLFLISLSLSAPYLEICLLPCTSIWPFSSLLTEVPPRFLSLWARSHFHATSNYIVSAYFQCCVISVVYNFKTENLHLLTEWLSCWCQLISYLNNNEVYLIFSMPMILFLCHRYQQMGVMGAVMIIMNLANKTWVLQMAFGLLILFS